MKDSFSSPNNLSIVLSLLSISVFLAVFKGVEVNLHVHISIFMP